MTLDRIDRTCRRRRALTCTRQASLALALFALAWCPPRVRAEDWSQFRGPNSSGISKTSKSLPETFSSTENVRWSAKVGEGVGGAVVAAGRVFVSGMT
ncbi:MAG TPA: hypothetical protein PKE05_17310, partial [Microthrixaceae bacterium]|nr:hypothetical protein [Microthrixaceae bacterium]